MINGCYGRAIVDARSLIIHEEIDPSKLFVLQIRAAKGWLKPNHLEGVEWVDHYALEFGGLVRDSTFSSNYPFEEWRRRLFGSESLEISRYSIKSLIDNVAFARDFS